MQKNDLVLQITSPAPFQLQGMSLCTLVLAFLAFTVKNNAASLMAWSMSALGTWVFILLFVFLSGAILFRNIFGKEYICFIKDGAPAGTAAACAIACDDLIAIESRPFPSSMSADGKMAMLGLGGAKLMLYTRAGAYPFGIGLSDTAARAAIQEIEQFCGRALLRQA